MCSVQNIPDECFEDILRHLKGIDLLKCTLVCPEWNAAIGSMRSCMRKIKLFPIKNLCPQLCPDFEEIITFLTNSERKYENLHLVGRNVLIEDQMCDALLAQERQWTHISITDVEFKTHKSFLEILKIFQSTVRKLELHRTHIGSNVCSELDFADLRFP